MSTNYADTEEEEVFEQIGDYLIVDSIATSTSMGSVLQAVSLETQNAVCIRRVRKKEIEGTRKFRQDRSVLDEDSGDNAAQNRGAQLTTSAEEDGVSRLQQSVKIMKRLRHKNLVQLHEVIEVEEEDTLYLVMDYIEHGAWFTVDPGTLTCSTTIPHLRVKSVLRQVLSGLKYLHSHHFIHRDIKPSNILIGEDDTPYLHDFFLAQASGSSEAFSSAFNGTMAFLPPEVFKATDDQKVDGPPCDVWALGVTIYAALYGELPFKASTPFELSKKVQNQEVSYPLTTIVTKKGGGTGAGSKSASSVRLIPKEWQEVLKQMLEKDPRKRITVDALRALPIFDDEFTFAPVQLDSKSSTKGVAGGANQATEENFATALDEVACMPYAELKNDFFDDPSHHPSVVLDVRSMRKVGHGWRTVATTHKATMGEVWEWGVIIEDTGRAPPNGALDDLMLGVVPNIYTKRERPISEGAGCFGISLYGFYVGAWEELTEADGDGDGNNVRLQKTRLQRVYHSKAIVHVELNLTSAMTLTITTESKTFSGRIASLDMSPQAEANSGATPPQHLKYYSPAVSVNNAEQKVKVLYFRMKQPPTLPNSRNTTNGSTAASSSLQLPSSSDIRSNTIHTATTTSLGKDGSLGGGDRYDSKNVASILAEMRSQSMAMSFEEPECSGAPREANRDHCIATAAGEVAVAGQGPKTKGVQLPDQVHPAGTTTNLQRYKSVFHLETEVQRLSPRSRERLVLIQSGNVTVLKTIGRGTYGSVHSAVLTSGEVVAVKDMHLAASAKQEATVQAVEREMEIMRTVRHPNIVQYFSAVVDDQEDLVKVYMELVTGGSLGGMARAAEEPFPEKLMKHYVRQIVEALRFIHGRGIAHRDIKGDNILLNVDGQVKLADFGAAKALGGATQAAASAADTLCGTPYFMAPEILSGEDESSNSDNEDEEGPKQDRKEGTKGEGDSLTVNAKRKRNPTKADIWAVGITVAELLDCGKPPWPKFKSAMKAFRHIQKDSSLPVLPDHFSPEVKSFILYACNRTPENRPTALQLLQHEWLTTD